MTDQPTSGSDPVSTTQPPPAPAAPVTQAPAPPPAPQAQVSGGGFSIGGLSAATIFSMVSGLVTSALGAGPWGIALTAVLTLGGFLGVNFLVNKWNSRVDRTDDANAGADAGNTAVDLANQGAQVSAGLSQLEQASPPAAGFPPKG